MYSLVAVAVVAFLISLLATPLCRDAFLRLGIVDLPDGKRKIHNKPIPRTGGVSVAIAYIGAFAVTALLPFQVMASLQRHSAILWRMLPPVALVFFTGLLDDLVGLKPWQKLTGQIVAAAWTYAAGVRIASVSGVAVGDWGSVACTILWLIVCSNAINLIDGLDGLASGIGLVAAITTMIAALMQGNIELALVTVPLVGALLGFLRYNFNPASIFLGDCGSLTVGFLLGCFGVLWAHKSSTLLGMIAPGIALAVPILDTSLAIIRRLLSRKPIFSADRGHIHHRLLDRGLTPRRAVLLMYGACAFVAALSLLHNAFSNQFGSLVIVGFCAAVFFAIQQLGYTEFEVARRLVIRGAFRDHLNAHVALRNLERALAEAEDPKSCWKAVHETCRDFGFAEVRLYVAGIQYADGWSANSKAHGKWSVRIPLSDHDDCLQLSRDFDQTAPIALASLADTLRTQLEPKCESFRSSSQPNNNARAS